MKEVLRERSSELHVPSSPQLITTPTLWHLATPFEGKANSQENALTLACLLHPTPALSGFPHQAATQVIAELEPFDRELFGGIVGWCDSEGNGEWVVTIRCARSCGKIRCVCLPERGLCLRRHRWVSGAKQASNFLPC